MTTENAQHTTYQLGTIALRLREDINVLVREYGGKSTYIIEDELTSRYYRIGLAEYTFLSLLDGKTTFAEALGRTASLMREQALTEDRAASFCRWLVQSGLASTDQSRSVHRLVGQSDSQNDNRVWGKFSVLMQRIRLFHPDRISTVGNDMLGWLFSGPIFVLWLILLALGVDAIVKHWDRFVSSTSVIVSPDNWLWLILTWLLLRVVHESAHAIACKRFGGTVREAGVALIVFLPLPYVDVSSAWRFGSRLQRIVTSAAGMMAELALAAAAAIVWAQTGPGVLNQNAFNIIISAGLMTILFNANPLMRFDGYYILADLLEMPNLATHGQQALVQIGKRWGLGLTSQTVHYPEGRNLLIVGYGLGAFLWRIVICVGLVLAADALFYGAGTVLALVAVIGWLILPVVRLLKFVAVGSKLEQPSRIRFAILTTTMSVLIWYTLTAVPWCSTATAPVLVDYYPQLEVRAAVPGFVHQVHVQPGQCVEKGQLLITMTNVELDTYAKQLESDIELSRQRTTVYLAEKQLSVLQIEQQTLASLEQRYAELKQQQAQLAVCAQDSGIILTGQLDRLYGEYLDVGDLVMTVGHSHERELLALVDQQQLESFQNQLGRPVHVHIAGTGTRWIKTSLNEVAPRATREFPHPALGAHAGGPLEVHLRSVQSGDNVIQEQALLNPHFLARASVPVELRDSLSPGQMGELAFSAEDGSIGHHLKRLFNRWWNLRQQALLRQLY